MKKSNYEEIIKTLQSLHKSHPTYGMGRHISTALADYGDTWGLSDKEFLFALQKYESELEYDSGDDKDLERIIEEGKNLDKLFKKDLYDIEEEEEY